MGKRDSNANEPAKTRAGRAQEPEVPGAYVLWRERHIYGSRFPDVAWRAAVGAVGSLLIGLGLVLVPLPGPGWVVVFLGLGVLATEFAWAQLLLERLRARVTVWTSWIQRQALLIRLVIGLVAVSAAAAGVVGALRLAGSPAWVPAWVPLAA